MSAARPRRRAVLAAALLSPLVLASCTAGTDDGAGDADAPGPAPSPPTSRSITFQGVEYTLPERPGRIVTLGDSCLQPALDLGAPVVATSGIAVATVPPARRDALRALPVVGTGREADPITVDDVLAHEPDLVLAEEETDAGLLDGLRSVVPLVVVHRSGAHATDWRGRIAGLGEVLARHTHPALERDYADHVERLRRERADELALLRVVLMRAWDRFTITAYGPESVVGRIYTDAGVRFVEAVQGAGDGDHPGEFDDALTHALRYLEGADLLMLASDYAGGLDAFTGGSLANSDMVTGHGAWRHGAGVLTVTSYAQVHDMLDRLAEGLQLAAGHESR